MAIPHLDQMQMLLASDESEVVEQALELLSAVPDRRLLLHLTRGSFVDAESGEFSIGERVRRIVRHKPFRGWVAMQLAMIRIEQGYTPAPAVLRSQYKYISERGAAAIARTEALRGLQILDLRHSKIEDDGAVALARAGHLVGLRELHLQHNRIGPEGARALALARHLVGLTALDLRHNPIGPEGAMALARSPLLAGLQTLHLYGADVRAAGCRALADSPHLPRHLRPLWSARRS